MTTSNEFGYVDESGNAFLNTPEGPRKVGSYVAGSPEEAFAFFTKKFADLHTEIELLIARIPEGKANAESTKIVLDKIQSTLESPHLIGDLTQLPVAREQIERLTAERREVVSAERAAQKAEALAKREEIAVTAEKLASSTSWKSTSEKFKTLLETWKTLPKADKNKEQELWDRFRKARSAFDKARKAYFAELEVVQSEAVAAKKSILKKAAQLSDSTEWIETANAFKRLMSDWKKIPRAARAEEEKLWAEFKGFQDKFFAAKNEVDTQQNQKLAANLELKLALLEKAEALLPIKDLEVTKAALRDIQEQWEKIGHVPSDSKGSVERRLRKVEDAVRALQDEQWHKSNPEVVQRANGLVNSFEVSLAKLDAEIADATAAGKSDAVAKLQAQRDQTASLLDAARAGAAQLG